MSSILAAQSKTTMIGFGSSKGGVSDRSPSIEIARRLICGQRIRRSRSRSVVVKHAAKILFALLAVVTLTSVLRAQADLGGHVGVAFPLVTHTTGVTEAPANTTTINDNFNITFPFGISVVPKGSPVVYDFEFVPEVHPSTRSVNLLVHPGVIRPLPQHWAVGLRAAFEVNQSSIGFTPLVNKSFMISGHKTRWFVEGDLPVRFSQQATQQNTTSVGFATHIGLSF